MGEDGERYWDARAHEGWAVHAPEVWQVAVGKPTRAKPDRQENVLTSSVTPFTEGTTAP
jgi:hypothetical protein